MKLPLSWLSDYTDMTGITPKEYDAKLTMSGSKVEEVYYLGAEIENVVTGKILSVVDHPDSDHLKICQLDVGKEEPVQIVTGAWNVHVGDYVPAALSGAHLPGGIKIEKGELRGVESDGMLCSLKELGLTTHDYPYGEIKAAAILGDYHALDPDVPSIPADISSGEAIFGSVIAAEVTSVEAYGVNQWKCELDTGSRVCDTICSCQNVHEGDMVAYDTKTGLICTLADLHAITVRHTHASCACSGT